MPYGLSSVPEGDQNGGVADTIPMAFSLFMVGQTESFVPAHTHPFDPPRFVSSARKPRLELTVEGSGYCAHISSPADSRRSFLPPCLFITGFNVTRVISDYIFVSWKTCRGDAIILKLGLTIDDHVLSMRTSIGCSKFL